LYLKSLLRGIYQGPPPDWPFRQQIEEELKSLPPEALHQRLQVIDPLLAARLHPHDKRRIIRGLEVFKQTGERLSHLQTQFDEGRPAAQVKVFVLSWPREELHRRIDLRVDQMFAGGLVEEVRGLLEQYGALSRTAQQAVGYREVIEYLRQQEPETSSKFKVQSSKLPGTLTAANETLNLKLGTLNRGGLAACIDRVKARTRQFARRQETWFRALSECTPVPMNDSLSATEVAEAVLSIHSRRRDLTKY
jgi:tRNA dimethylallyltransferase